MHIGKKLNVHSWSSSVLLSFLHFWSPKPPLTQCPSPFHPFAAAKIQFRDWLITKQYQTGLTALFHPHPCSLNSGLQVTLCTKMTLILTLPEWQTQRYLKRSQNDVQQHTAAQQVKNNIHKTLNKYDPLRYHIFPLHLEADCDLTFFKGKNWVKGVVEQGHSLLVWHAVGINRLNAVRSPATQHTRSYGWAAVALHCRQLCRFGWPKMKAASSQQLAFAQRVFEG